MCYLCQQFADSYERWYFNPAVYARRLYKVRREGDESRAFGAVPRTMGRDVLGREYLEARESGDLETMNRVKQEAERHLGNHISQVITLEEALQVFDIVYPIILFPCPCRRVMTGISDEVNFGCINFGPAIYKWERWPDGYLGMVQFLHPDEAKDIVTKLNKRGLMQMLGTFGVSGEWAVGVGGTPHAAGMCQCDYPDCVFIRNRLDYGLNILWKGHYVAQVDFELCDGCTKCIHRCQFRALNFMPTASKAYIDMFQCFGCGLCSSVCPQDAIKLVERANIPVLANVW